MITLTLTEDQSTALKTALGVAKERYEEHAKTLRSDVPAGCKASYQRLAEQFDRQSADMDTLFNLLQEAEDAS